MARTINRLSHRKVETLKKPGMHSDGGGLYLQVTQGSDGTPRKSWLFRYAVGGRERQMGLGPLSDVQGHETNRALSPGQHFQAGHRESASGEAVAERSGWQVVKVYEDAGISGAKGRDKRPGLDAMLKAVILVWRVS